MKMRNKWISMITVLCLLLVLLAGCAEAEPAETTQPPATTESVATTEATTQEVQPLYCPWEYDVAEKAEGKLHYYFMASGGYSVAGGSEKWGDATLIVFPDGTNMLIDSGQTFYAPVLLENLKRMGIEKLDYLLLTHSHSDHINGAVCEGGLFDTMEIGQVYISGVYNGKLNLFNNRTEDPYLVDNICKEKNIPVQIIKQGDELTFGDVKMRVLWPNADQVGQIIEGTENVNNSSLVLRFSFGEHASIFPGDIYESAEAEFLALYKDQPELLRAELLKMPHHGHTTSSTMNFATAIIPKLVIGSAYAGMTSKVKDVYTLCQSTVLWDKKHGYIHVVTDGTEMTWETSQ